MIWILNDKHSCRKIGFVTIMRIFRSFSRWKRCHHAGRTTNDEWQTNEQGKIGLLSLWAVGRLSFAIDWIIRICNYSGDTIWAEIWKYLAFPKSEYSNVGLGSSLRGEPGLTTFRSQGCPWKIISGLRQSDTHRWGTRASSTWQNKTIKLL